MIKRLFIVFFFKLLFINLFNFFFFLRVGGGGARWVASNFVICIYMLTLQFHPVLLMSLEISPLHLTPHLQKSVI